MGNYVSKGCSIGAHCAILFSKTKLFITLGAHVWGNPMGKVGRETVVKVYLLEFQMNIFLYPAVNLINGDCKFLLQYLLLYFYRLSHPEMQSYLVIMTLTLIVF